MSRFVQSDLGTDEAAPFHQVQQPRGEGCKNGQWREPAPTTAPRPVWQLGYGEVSRGSVPGKGPWPLSAPGCAAKCQRGSCEGNGKAHAFPAEQQRGPAAGALGPALTCFPALLTTSPKTEGFHLMFQ